MKYLQRYVLILLALILTAIVLYGIWFVADNQIAYFNDLGGTATVEYFADKFATEWVQRTPAP